MVQGILDGMRWLGLDWDEGPFFQSQRLLSINPRPRNSAKAGTLITAFVEGRAGATKERKLWPPASRRCMTGAAERSMPQPPTGGVQEGEPGALRFAVPEGGATAFEDAVFGKVEFANSELENFVLLAPTASLLIT